MENTTLIFDLDGTLANTAPDLIGTLNRITEPHGLPSVSLDQVGQIVGHGARAMIERAFTTNSIPLSADLHDTLFSEFLEDYSANIANETHLFDGVLEAMKALQSEGCDFALCTNKLESLARELLTELEVTSWFSAVSGGDTFAFRKPDPRHLEETVRLMGSNIQNAVMIGDSPADIDAANNAGIASVAVTFGYSDKPVEELGATEIIGHFDELQAAISRIRNSG